MGHLAAPVPVLLAQGGGRTPEVLAIPIDDWIGAALALVLTVAVVALLRSALRRWRGSLTLGVDPGVRTRMRLLQRMGTTLVVLVGLAIAAAQLGVLGRVASTVLAGSAITAIVVGFAARAALANALAGVVLTITQPVRVGDHVRVGDQEGVVHDVTLSSTVLSTVHGTLIRIPNETVAQSVVANDTIGGGGVLPETSVLLPYGADVDGALEVASGLPGVQIARLGPIETDGWNRIVVRGERVAPGDRVPTEARLRAALLATLREAGLVVPRPPEQEEDRAP